MPYRNSRRPFTSLPNPPTRELATRGFPHYEEAGYDINSGRPWKVELYLLDVYSPETPPSSVSVELSCRSLGKYGDDEFEINRQFQLNKDPATGLLDTSYYAHWAADLPQIPSNAASCAVILVANYLCRECPGAKTIIASLAILHSSWFPLLIATEDRVRCGSGGLTPSEFDSAYRAAAVKSLDKVVIKRRHLKKTPCCVICLSKFKVGSKATRMPCSHTFHGDCILEWIHNRPVCPACRFVLPCLKE